MNTNAELNMKIFSGNEYWAGSLSTSSDPAAACCTQVKKIKIVKYTLIVL